MRSIHHRGTPDNPGLVLALDAKTDTECRGVALQVADGEEDTVLQYLRDRELISSAYLEKRLNVRLEDGRGVEAVTYVVDANHVQYCGGLPLEEQAKIISTSTGGRGPNDEYLYQTFEHLEQLGVKDSDLEWLVRRVKDLSS